MSDTQSSGTIHLPARPIGIPAHLSPIAQAYLGPQQPPASYPALEDKAGWLAYAQAQDEAVLPLLQKMVAQVPAQVEERDADGARVFDITPEGVSPDERGIVLDFHGGGLILCGGELCRMMGVGVAARLGYRVWSVDYRMPPAHPYPAALDDALNAYRALLRERSPAEIIVNGGSAGGNLAAALLLRAHAEGLPMPAGLVLATPEADLTESGDSFQTNEGIDPALHSLMPVNLLYANGQDLKQPYLSPLFGDLAGFPPTLLTTGTRDLYLSNTVRLHRALRTANVPAELHVVEAAPHTGFPGSPEGEEINGEVRRFVQQALKRG